MKIKLTDTSEFKNLFADSSETIINKLKNGEIDFESQSHFDGNLLHWACHFNNKDVVKYLIEECGFLSRIDEKNRNGFTPLYSLCGSQEDSNIALIEYLIEKGADVNFKHSSGFTPLYLAFKTAGYNFIKPLIEKKANVSKDLICKAYGRNLLEKFYGLTINGHEFNSDNIFVNFESLPGSQNTNFWKLIKFDHALGKVASTIQKGLDITLNKLLENNFFKTFIDYVSKHDCQIVFWDKDHPLKLTTMGRSYEPTKKISIFIDPQNMDFTQITGTIFHELEHFYHDSKPYGPEDTKSKELWDEMVNKHVIPSNGAFHNICKVYDEDQYTIELPAWTFGQIVEEILESNLYLVTNHFVLVRALWDNILKPINKDLVLSDLLNEKVLTKLLIEKIKKYNSDDKQNTDDINYLIENKVDINAKDFINGLMNLAFEGKNSAFIKFLIEKNTDVNSINEFGNTPCTNIEIINLLIEKDANINAKNEYGYSPLYTALSSENPSIKIVELLINRKASINTKNDYGYTPLHIAIFNKNINLGIIKLLTDNKANINSKVKNDHTPLYTALYSKNINPEIVEFFINNKNDIENTELHMVCEAGKYLERAKLLINNKANINAINVFGNSPLYLACKNENYEIINLLIRENADVTLASHNGYTPLHWAFKKNINIEIVDTLIKHTIKYNGNINAKNEDGYTPLHLACKAGTAEHIKLLIDNKADVNAVCGYSFTPLHFVCLRNANIQIFKFLIDNEADVNAVCGYSFTPLYLACKVGTDESIKLLIKSKADAKFINKYYTPLLSLALNNKNINLETIKYLVENKADVNKVSLKDLPPIEFYKNHPYKDNEIFEFLIKEGVDNEQDNQLLFTGDVDTYYDTK